MKEKESGKDKNKNKKKRKGKRKRRILDMRMMRGNDGVSVTRR